MLLLLLLLRPLRLQLHPQRLPLLRLLLPTRKLLLLLLRPLRLQLHSRLRLLPRMQQMRL